jgi:ATP-binding cassette, subfamily B, bacterial PglK
MVTIRMLLDLFERRERWQMLVVFAAMLVTAVVEAIGVVSILPFVALVANPDIVQTSDRLRWVYETLQFTDTHQFLVFVGFAVLVVIAFSNAVSALTTWMMLRFTWNKGAALEKRLLARYLDEPYPFFLDHNSAKLTKTIFAEVKSVVNGVLMPVMKILSRGTVAVLLLAMMIVVDWKLAAAVATILGGSYALIYATIRKGQSRRGLERVELGTKRYKAAAEAFGGIKDVKVLQREREFVERFRPVSLTYSQTMTSNAIIGKLPRYLIETLVTGGIIAIVLYYLQQEGGVAEVLPVISLYAFAGMRLMPELQHLFTDLAQIRFNRAALDDLVADYRDVPDDSPRVGVKPLPFRRAIEFEGVTFRYPEAAAAALDGVSLRIEHNQTVGLIGASGSGKTTLVDLLLGLYPPARGRILVDDTELGERTIAAWRRQVGYVPQNIFLIDDSIAANIAFGVPPEEIDHDAVLRAARIAHLHEFVTTLPGGYETVVGERGVRLSGGQRQRIGIARALYHDPAVLIMDEATSALDGATETAVMEAIHELSGRKTIILIAHRLSTVQECDMIYLLERGRLQDQGTYEELAAGSLTFRSMAKMDAAATR